MIFLKDEDSELVLTRNISGATVLFYEFGHVFDVSFPTDYSCARMTGFSREPTAQSVVDILHTLEYDVSPDCVRIMGCPSSSTKMAIVKVKDPLFATSLCDRMKLKNLDLQATAIAVDFNPMNWRKVLVSWHKASRSVWLNYGQGDIAKRVATKFNKGTYKCLGQLVKSSAPKCTESARSYSRNHVPWTIILSDVPNNATLLDIEKCIKSPHDEPRHVEMGPASYSASQPEVSVAVRSSLEKYGPLESFHLIPTLGGKRVKAVAMFQDEEAAISATALDSMGIGILEKGRLTVTLVRSAKVKVLTSLYTACQAAIEEKANLWRLQYMKVHTYTDTVRHLTTIKIEGSDAKEVSAACRALDELTRGVVLRHDGDVLWKPILNNNGNAYRRLKAIADGLGVVIVREKLKQQLRYHGPTDKLQQAIQLISNLLHQERTSSHEINLTSEQFSWAIRGGFRSVQQNIGEDVIVFDVVSKKIAIHGTEQQRDAALAIIDSKNSTSNGSHQKDQSDTEEDCPICFCEVESPIQASCKHKYCLECFENYCKSASSTSQKEFQVECCGSEGKCATVFTLQELKGHLSSSVLESVLQMSFSEYITRHPQEFRFCPTPDCDQIYRCTAVSAHLKSKRTCTRCFEQHCTSCHVQHGDYTCAEYKDIASGGYEALERLKKRLRIKDCPRCKTSMEKTDGCDHMTCAGCKAHICWKCMAVFEGPTQCYTHMNRMHGNIGIDYI